MTLRQPSLVNKDGSGLATSPRSPESCPKGLILSPPYLLTSAWASCYPLTPDSLWGPGPRDLEAGPKVLYLSRLAQPQVQEALQVPVTPPLWGGCRVGAGEWGDVQGNK